MRTLFHLGMPKAASTTLQYNLFSARPNIAYLLSPHQSWLSVGDREKIFSVWNQHQREDAYDTSPIDCASLERLLSDSSRELAVVSCEQAAWMEMPQNCIRRISQLGFSSPEFLFICRDPSEILRSFYDMDPCDPTDPGRAWISPVKFEDLFLNSDKAFFSRFRLWLEYQNVINLAIAAFGRSNVHVFSFDRLFIQKDSESLFRFATILNCPPAVLEQALFTKPKNLSKEHRASSFARRLLGDFHLSSVLPSSVVVQIARNLSRFMASASRPTKAYTFTRVASAYPYFLPDSG